MYASSFDKHDFLKLFQQALCHIGMSGVQLAQLQSKEHAKMHYHRHNGKQAKFPSSYSGHAKTD